MQFFLKTKLRCCLAYLTICIIVLPSLLIGCTKQETEPEFVAVLDPVLINQISLNEQISISNKQQSLSPDGKYLLAAVWGDISENMMALPTDDKGESICLHSVDAEWVRNNLVQWYPAGWLSKTKPVFIIHGWQSKGDHKGERGTAIYIGDLETHESTLLAYKEAPIQGTLIEDAWLSDSLEKVRFRVADKLWECDISSGETKIIYDNLPTYYGISQVIISPDGEKIVYSVYDDHKSGVFLIDVNSKTETPLLITDDSLSFFPMWSPDGKYIATYTSNRINNQNSGNTPIYSMIPAEDGPMPAAEEITIVDLHGNVVKTISAENDFIANAAWLSDSNSLIYISTPVEFGRWGEVLSMEYDKIWMENIELSAEPIKVGDVFDIEQHTHDTIEYIYPVGSLPDGKSALLNVIDSKGSSTIWQVSTQNPISKVADGWWETGRLVPQFLDSIMGIVSSKGESKLYLIGPNNVVQFGEPSSTWATVAAFNSDTLAILESSFESKVYKLFIYKMIQYEAKEL